MIEAAIRFGIWGAILGHLITFRSSYAKIISVYAGSKIITCLVSSLGDSNKTTMIKTAGTCCVITSVANLIGDTLKILK